MLMCERTSVSLSTHSYVCTCVRARSRSALKNRSPFITTVYFYRWQKRVYKKEAIVELFSRNNNPKQRLFNDNIHTTSRTINSNSDSFKSRLRDSTREKRKKEKTIEIDLSLRRVDIFGHATHLPFTDSFRYFSVYSPLSWPEIAMAIGREKYHCPIRSACSRF